ncbi:MAG: DUF1987 domain-containing protein [Bacteroidia bacterium]
MKKMNNLVLAATDTTPKITLDHLQNKFEIIGESCPENAKQFYAVMLSWLEDYKEYLHFMNDQSNTKKNLIFTIHLSYVSSSALKNTYDFLQKIETLKPLCESITIRWLYDKDDEDMEDNGNEFSTMVNIPFSIEQA